MTRILLTAILFLASCASFEDVHEQSGTAALDDLAAQAVIVESEIVRDRDQPTGWPSASDCDGTLWAGLLCAAGAPGVQIAAAELAPGVIGRRPGSACWTPEGGDVGAKSTTSQDMATGYLWCLWRTKDAALATRFADACQARPLAFEDLPACIIGEPYPEMASRVVLRPNGVGLLGRIVYALSAGADDRAWRNAPVWYASLDAEADYERHLAALGIALQGEVDEGTKALGLDIKGHMLERLRVLVDADPLDWTAQAALAVYTGDYAPAVRVLMDDATPCPSYTRGSDINCKVSWLWAARHVLRRHKGETP